MYIYSYDTEKCKLLDIIEQQTETSVTSNVFFDLNVCDVYVGKLDNDRQIIRYTTIIKDDEAIFRALSILQAENAEMKSKLAEYTEAIEKGML